MGNRIAVMRGKKAREHLGDLAVSTFYERIQKGLIPPGVPLGGRIVGWPAFELATDEDIRHLVRNLIRKRACQPIAGTTSATGDAA